MKFCYTPKVINSNVRAAVAMKRSYWAIGQTIKIGFIGGTKKQRKFVMDTCMEWLKYINLKFKFVSNRTKSHVRISFVKGAGSWSMVGTDANFIVQRNPTMNFGWLDKETVLHEFGHMLGLLHEHQNPKTTIEWNEKVVIDSLSQPPNNWSLEEIRHNVLSVHQIKNVDATEVDLESIMMYFFPSSWTKNNIKVPQNTTISAKDAEFVQTIYPFTIKEDNDNNEIFNLIGELFPQKKRLKYMTTSQLKIICKYLKINYSSVRNKTQLMNLMWNKFNS